MQQFATHIYRNGVILTMDSRCSVASCLAVNGETILAVGSEQDVAAFRNAATEIVDLRGQTMLPGFYDGHSHFMRAGMYNRYYLDLNPYPVGDIRTHDDIRRKVRAALEKLPDGEWLLCTGYDDTAVAEARHFTLAELDELAPRHPLFLRHISGHLALCNSRAFAAAGIDGRTPNPAGGVFRHDGDGGLTGLVEEPAAMEMVLHAAPQMTEEKWLGAVERATADYVAKGVTTAHDGGVTTAMWQNYMTAHARGMLRNRVQLLPKHGQYDFSLAPTSRCGAPLTPDGMLSMGAVKLFQDGSLQGYTGYLTNPYHVQQAGGEDELWRGYAIYPLHELMEIVSGYHRQGWQVAIHGNGDAGIDDILTAYEAAQKDYPRADARHLVIHCQTAREDQLDRIARLGVVPSFFAVHTYYWGDRHRDIFLGEDRAARIDPLRSALLRHIPFTCHNDTSVTPIDPLLSVWSAVNRLTSSGKVLGPAQRIPVLDALKSITIWGAYQFHEERTKGSLEPGKLADMVVLGENPLTVAPETLKDLPITATIVGNRLVYGSLAG